MQAASSGPDLRLWWPLLVTTIFDYDSSLFIIIIIIIIIIIVSFLRWGETESTWYVGHYLAYCTSPNIRLTGLRKPRKASVSLGFKTATSCYTKQEN
jgi:hypothetical protein